MKERLTLEFDGGSRGNPGPAAIGIVIRAADGTPLVTLGRVIGRATNNVAEYKALITALQQAKELGATEISVRGDSELIVKQMRGEYRVKNAELRQLYDQAQALFRQFPGATIEHNYRHKNALADKLANLAMDRGADVTEVNGFDAPSSRPEPSGVVLKAGDRLSCSRCGSVLELRQASNLPPDQLRTFVCACGSKLGLRDALAD